MTEPTAPTPGPPTSSRRFSRRTLFGATGAGVVVAAAAGVTGARLAEGDSSSSDVVAFRGTRQAGIITEAQDRLHFASFDVITDSRDELIDMLKRWTSAAERMTKGQETVDGGAVDHGEYNPPADTGEALGLEASALTLTVGFGPGLFGPSASDPSRGDRFGIGDRKPAALKDLPGFAKDAIEPSRSHGDICVQACANDPQVAVHAIRNLARLGFGVVSVRWSQLGFGRTSTTTANQQTPRNMFGFKDGTANIRAEQTDVLDRWVWVDPADNPASAQWMTGGSYLVARRIRMDIEPWDRANLSEQEAIVGRTKGVGAPLGMTREDDTPNFAVATSDGPTIARDAHVRLAHPDNLNGIQILRRGYNFTDGSDGFGHLDAGLFFIAYCRDPGAQFVPMQRQLASKDAMMEYLSHNGSALFACPPGLKPGEWWGQHLFT
ncbi:iron uptake transporter deferrochelatase/peroxidase subunit [Williamsia herbipolensis]|uniref:iron uptake transporter deferrochelatase/peroxidase subunit n=1 Tax=Williamsia herbipolensis TaxID=1603258 RepID=UPI0005F81D7D|nr:iron uptake transporter deferrochelatase/peroxidase subunit [Williamsia herbipolensis]MCX6470239.1 iron uptake transporter deferrochelatase/peroxidase subunit [Mycobacteriales bacterium]